MKPLGLACLAAFAAIVSGCGGGSGGGGGSTPPSSAISSVSSSSAITSSISSAAQSSLPSIDYAVPNEPAAVYLNAEGRVDWNNVGVHDPSVIKAGDTYYIFGSHLAAAKSTDLVRWEMISSLSQNHLVDESGLFQTYTSEIAEGIRWTDGFTGNWAANVIASPEGKFWFYYNHCGQQNPDVTDAVAEVCHNRSYLGLAEAESIEGPYQDRGVFLRSGYRNAAEFAEFPLDNGQTTWRGAQDPNVIDPAAYYDKNGELWMVYGSYSGGLFVLAMDKTTGKPKPGQGYGKRVVGGDYRAIEGPFMLYSPVSDYYYLFYSVAGFALNDGYNIRIARSKTPDGPFLDPAGNDIANQSGLAIGGKLLGGFEFVSLHGDKTKTWGYQSPGHNSAYYDEQSGKHLLVTHTRFPQTSTPFPGNAEAHAVRVHEMHLTEDDWLVAMPTRYVPLEGDNLVDPSELAGHYKLVDQGNHVNTDAIRSVSITLNRDGTIHGAVSGTYNSTNGKHIALTIGDQTYSGAVSWQWSDDEKRLIPVFSAMSDSGSGLMGIYESALANTQADADNIFEALEKFSLITPQSGITQLPVVGSRGATITYSSSQPEFISASGAIRIPTAARGDQRVELAVSVTLDGKTFTENITVDLVARPAFKNAIAHYTFDSTLADSKGVKASPRVTNRDLRVVTDGPINFDANGRSGNAVVLDGDMGLRLPDNLIESSTYTVSFWQKTQEVRSYSPAFFAATGAATDTWVSVIPGGAAHFTNNPLVWSRAYPDNWTQVVHTAPAPINEWQHYAITYDGADLHFYIDGNLIGKTPRDDFFKDGGEFALGANYGWDNPFKGMIDELIVYDTALTPQDVKHIAYNNKTNPAEFAGIVRDSVTLGNMNNVRDDFVLPIEGPVGSSIQWASSDERYISIDINRATVTQPSEQDGDQQVTLTATIHYDDQVFTKQFPVTVKTPGPVVFSFNGNLDPSDNSMPSATATGDRINNTGGTLSFGSGVSGEAVVMNGTGGVRLPDDLIRGDSYAVSMWIKPAAHSSFTTAFFGGASSTAWLSLVPSMGGVDRTRLWAHSDGYYDLAELNQRIPLDTWTHVVISVDAADKNSVSIYLNGQLAKKAEGFPKVMNVLGEVNEFALGVNYWDVPFKGAIDELMIFSGAINSQKVSEIYQSGSK